MVVATSRLKGCSSVPMAPSACSSGIDGAIDTLAVRSGVARVTGGASEAGEDAVPVAGGAPAAAGAGITAPEPPGAGPARVRYSPDGPGQETHTETRETGRLVPGIGYNRLVATTIRRRGVPAGIFRCWRHHDHAGQRPNGGCRTNGRTDADFSFAVSGISPFAIAGSYCPRRSCWPSSGTTTHGAAFTLRLLVQTTIGSSGTGRMRCPLLEAPRPVLNHGFKSRCSS
jgi:hypothetical protein